MFFFKQNFLLSVLHQDYILPKIISLTSTYNNLMGLRQPYTTQIRSAFLQVDSSHQNSITQDQFTQALAQIPLPIFTMTSFSLSGSGSSDGESSSSSSSNSSDGEDEHFNLWEWFKDLFDGEDSDDHS